MDHPIEPERAAPNEEPAWKVELSQPPRSRVVPIIAISVVLPLLYVLLDLNDAPEYAVLAALAAVALTLLGGAIGPFRPPVALTVGEDGLLVDRGRERKFIPYAEIRAVRHLVPRSPSWIGATIWRVAVDTLHAGTLELCTHNDLSDFSGVSRETWRRTAPARDTNGTRLVRAIEAGIARRAISPAERGASQALAREGRSGAAWLSALTSRHTGGAALYREALDAASLWRILDDPRATISARVGASVVLSKHDHPRARDRLRIAAEASANPKLRVALERVAYAQDDDALAGALGEIDDDAGEPEEQRPRRRAQVG